jgi:hypothetical protein|tara:strand:+ start:45 stop:434 length:390 start_codon:yes stop_codon:yes gene_type:complete
MFQRKPSNFRRRPTGRSHRPHGGSNQNRMRSNSFSNGQSRNNFRNTLSAEKLLEKYNSLAKEAMSSGDKTIAENYLQHADHFMRVIEDKNKMRSENKVAVTDKQTNETKNLSNGNEKVEEPKIKKIEII